jgi:hypothetical protein
MKDGHGKEYPIIKHKNKNRYYIQHKDGQLTVTSAMVEIQWQDWQKPIFCRFD